MHVIVHGIRLFVDIEGAGLVPEGPRLRRKPTLVLIHGGPGADHSLYKPFFSSLADVAQVVYFDNRGDGRSERGPAAAWTLDQWADDVRGLCDALGVERPIVLGESFGGIVAMNYALRHPGHPAALVLASTLAAGSRYTAHRVAMFEQLGGPRAGALARRRFEAGDTGPDVLRDWLEVAVPLYLRSGWGEHALARIRANPDTTAWFNRPEGEARQFDLLSRLREIDVPTLVLGGRLDPMTPIEAQRDIADALPPGTGSFHAFDDCGHGVFRDRPDEAGAVLRDFLARVGAELAVGDSEAVPC